MRVPAQIRWRPWLIRLAGSALLLALVLAFVPLDQLRAGFSRIHPVTFLLVLVVFAAGHTLAAAKWWMLMGAPFAFLLAVRAHFAGLAANLCLPTVAGGDAVRAAMAYRALPDAGRIAAAATADRIIDIGALAAIAVVGAIQADAGSETAVTALVLILGIGATLLWATPWLVSTIWTRFPSLPLRGIAEAVGSALSDLSKRPGLLIFTWALSVGIQCLFILLALVFARAVGLEIGFAQWAFAWALAKIIAILPVSINGLGLREASLATILAPFGAPSGLVVAAGLAWQVVLFVTGALGALVLVLSPKLAPDGVSDRSGANSC